MDNTDDLITTTIYNFTEAFRDPEQLSLIVLPTGILLVLIFIFGVWISVRRRKDRSILADLMQHEPAEPTPEEVVPPAAARPEEVSEVLSLDHQSWLKRLNLGLAKTRSGFVNNLSTLFTGGKKIDDDLLEEVHEVLYRADVGVKTADRLVAHLRKSIDRDAETKWEQAQSLLQEEVVNILNAPEKPLNTPSDGPWVILVVGVNGVGKTTTIAKLAANFIAQEKSVLLCAADTYRAAAIDQLKVWGQRLSVDVIAHQQGSDPAAVAYDGVKAAISRKSDILLVDTAGRLHSKKELMEELSKINRVIGKDLPGAPHETWLVIDATTGQNALMQIKAFKDVVALSGLVVTKLDGTAKGGVVIGAADQHDLPIRYIGVGEKAADLQSFSAQDYAGQLFQ